MLSKILYENMSVLITGGAGFIGSHISEYLIDNGAEVICIDNLSSGSYENIKQLIKSRRFKFIEKDACQINGFNNIELVIHVASIASVEYYQNIPIKTMDVNTIGTKRCLEIARKNDARLVFTMTQEEGALI